MKRVYFTLWMLVMVSCAPITADLAWDKAETRHKISAYQTFLQKYPGSAYTDSARIRITELTRNAWEEAYEANTLEQYQKFMAEYPDNEYAQKAQEECAALVKCPSNIQEMRRKIRNYPASPSMARVRSDLDALHLRLEERGIRFTRTSSPTNETISSSFSKYYAITCGSDVVGELVVENGKVRFL